MMLRGRLRGWWSWGVAGYVAWTGCADPDASRVRADAGVTSVDAGGKADEVAQAPDAQGVATDANLVVADSSVVVADSSVAVPDASVVNPSDAVLPDAGAVDGAAADASASPERLCGAAWLEAAAPLMADLYFLSESDYPLDPVLVTDNLGAAVTPADALALFVGPADPLVETREAAAFRDRLTLDFDPADPGSVALAAQFTALFAFLEPQLDAALVVRVSEIEVHVYYLGRTACGELAGFHTVSIET